MAMAPTSGQPPQGHTRTSSFFSFRRQNTTEPNAQRSASMLVRPNQPPPNNQSTPPTSAPAHQQHFPQNGMKSPPVDQSQPQNMPTHAANPGPAPASAPAPAAPAPLHPEIRSLVQLTLSHARKIYFSGPLVRRIERQPDGQRPAKDEGWTEVWAQLGGTTLSIWDMKKVQEASAQGKEVPPTYVNVTDAFVQVLGSVTVPATPGYPATATTPAVPPTQATRYANVLTLNTAGSNLLLFSCPSTQALISWASGLRLAAWEKSRLEEIYTAHLIRITLSARDIPTTLVRGHMEGWVRIRVAGQTDWKKVWMIIASPPVETGGSDVGHGSGKKNRMSNLFSAKEHGSGASQPTKPLVSMYASPKPKDKKRALLSISEVTQVFAVYPERPELITRSTLIKMEGLMGDEDAAAGMRNREGWLLIMPELEGGLSQSAEMLKWVVGMHDAFGLYGRPQAWTWDPRDAASLMYAYPVGPQKDDLFLDREVAENLDPRDDRTSSIRSRLLSLVGEKMRTDAPANSPGSALVSPGARLPSPGAQLPSPDARLPSPGQSPNPQSANSISGFQLPPLSFDSSSPRDPRDGERRMLTPITERSSVSTMPMGRDSLSNRLSHGFGPLPDSATLKEVEEEGPMVAPHLTHSPTSSPDLRLAESPRSFSPAPLTHRSQKSQDSYSQPFGRATAPTSPNSSIAPASLQAVSPPPPSHPGIERAESRSSALTSPHSLTDQPVAKSNASVLSSPYSPRVPTKTLDDHLPPSFERVESHASTLTSPHSISDQPVVRDDASILSSPYSPGATPKSPPLVASNASILSSPYSPGVTPSNPPLVASNASILSSPYSPSNVPDSFLPPAAPQAAKIEPVLSNEAGALYYMQYEASQNEQNSTNQSQRLVATAPEPDDDSSSESAPEVRAFQRTDTASSVASRSPPPSQTASAVFERNKPQAESPPTTPSPRYSPTLQKPLGRRPSGARAQGTSRTHTFSPDPRLQLPPTEEDDSQSPTMDSHPVTTHPAQPVEDDLDALAALSYLEVDDSQPTQSTRHAPSAAPIAPPPPPPAPVIVEPAPQYKSSFAPSKHAAERKAKAQAQQAAQQAASQRPGRANGRNAQKPKGGGWNESSDEEDDDNDEEEEDDDDADSDGERPARKTSAPSPANRPPQSASPANSYNERQHTQPLHLRQQRNLPQIPGSRFTQQDDYTPRSVSNPHYGDSRRTFHEDGTPIRTQADFPTPGAARQTMWSQVLDPTHNPATAEPTNGRDTFVTMDTNETLTKAFTPQGLLSAGMQDKQDRSAKRQEELARESGASLINVPHKPPPPQTGLLGAITAHERERKREGGMGAALTEREREKRVAEDRQRQFDEHQRQQLDQMAQGGSMYGYNPMMNPMMMGMNPMMAMNPMMTGGMNPMMTGQGLNPMMTGQGMNPMMTGQGMNPMMSGFPGMMGGYNPQHMFAAQQAAQAYQQAMMAFSVAGSQVGGEGGAGGPAPGAGGPMNPMMTGGSMFDPRMSMMGMGMGMGMPGQGGMQGGVPMQGTGTAQSVFDPRFSPSADPMAAPPPLGHFASNSSSPKGRGSPLARPPEIRDPAQPSSRPTTPKIS